MNAAVTKPKAGYRLSRTELRQRWQQPTNTRAEIAEKVAAYLAAGSREVWVVGDDGVPEIHGGEGCITASTLGFDLPHPPNA